MPSFFEEFICREIDRGNISPEQFTDKPMKVLLHGHCQQKAIASTAPTIRMLSLPVNYSVEEINDGCCGMAGAFGYEKEHYDLSMKIGEMVLFPAVRESGRRRSLQRREHHAAITLRTVREERHCTPWR